MREWVIWTAFILALATIGIGWQAYAFVDCRDVGHSLLYCILRIGRF